MVYFTNKFNNNEKRLIFKIKKSRYIMMPHNRADIGVFLFTSSLSGSKYIGRRLVEIKCNYDNEKLILVATDLIPNNSNIGIYFVETDDFVEVYCSESQYIQVGVDVISSFSNSAYTFLPFSAEVMAEGVEYTQPKPLTSTCDVDFKLGSGLSFNGKSGTINKAKLDKYSKIVHIQAYCTPNDTFTSGTQVVFECPIATSQSTPTTKLYIDCLKTDDTYTKIKCYKDGDKFMAYLKDVKELMIDTIFYIEDISSLQK